jgi:hypothetical protein
MKYSDLIRVKPCCFLILFVMCCVVLPNASAQDDPPTLESVAEQLKALTEVVQSLQETMGVQQDRINELETENETLRTQSSEVAQEVSDLTEESSVGGHTRAPDIGLVVDLMGLFTESREDVDGNDRRSVRDLELILGHQVDAKTRLDASISFSDEDDTVELEEAYVSYDEVLWGWSSRVGRIRPEIGSSNLLHRDELYTADAPLVIQRYFGEEGYYRTGLEFSRSLPSFSDRMSHRLIGGIVEGGIGEGGTMFGELRRHPTMYARLANDYAINDNSQFDFGASVLVGSATEDDRSDVRAVGLDAGYARAFEGVKRLELQTELFIQDRDDLVVNDDPFGYYTLLDYRLNERWGAGGRYDSVELITDDDDEDTAYSVYLTWFQSSFSRWRFQYQHIDFAGGGNDDRLYLQATFGLGKHGHKLQ